MKSDSAMKFLFGGVSAALAFSVAAGPVLRVVRADAANTPLLKNGNFENADAADSAPWRPWQKGFRLGVDEGRGGSRAVVCERREGEGEFGASQTITLNRTNTAPLVVRGWSKAENVTGSPDNGYSLYVDIIYADGTPLWGQTAPFRCGTHDWERREFVLLPDKPVKTLTLHCLFRGHTGKVWFDDVSLEEAATPSGSTMFQGVPVEPPQAAVLKETGPKRTFATKDGLRLTLRGEPVASLQLGGKEFATSSPSGFLVRDFTANSDVFSFSNGVCAGLNLQVKARFTPKPDHILVEGLVSDTTGRDRAITLLFTLPIDAAGWQWGDDMRQSRSIGGNGEFANLVNVGCGANGKMSRYPLAAIWNGRIGFAFALDMTKPAQYRLVYHAATRQFFIAYDFALVKETTAFPSSADFRFVIFQFDPHWGFRAALQNATTYFQSSLRNA